VILKSDVALHTGKTKEKSVESGRDTFDRDVDSQAGRLPRVPKELLTEYQRIVVNPLLGVLAWVATTALLSVGVRRRSLALFLSGLSLLVVGFLVHQFHCLDCGATGWLVRYRSHACPKVLARYQEREFRRFRVPNVATQITIWFYLLAAVLLLVVLLLNSPR